MISSAAEHRAVDMAEMFQGLVERLNATIDAYEFVRPSRFQPVDARIVERRDVAIFLGTKPLQPRLAGMHPKRIGTGCQHAVGQRVESGFGILVVDTNPAFDGDRDFHRRLHRRDAFRHQHRRLHQAGAERA